MERSVKQLFSNISGTYDLLNRVLSFGTDQRWRKKGVSLLPHGKNIRVLDLASGTLDLALQYAKRGEGEIYCVDFALAMLLTGQRKTPPTLDSRIHLVCGDGLWLPFPDGYFDAAMCAWGMRNIPNTPAALKEVARVLKPGGSFLILEFFKPKRIVSKIFAKTYGRHVMPAIGRWISRDKGAYDYLHRSIQKFFTRTEYEKLLQAHGFEIITSRDLTGGVNSLILANTDGH
ncbi:MAG: ubiquinone/menaquinone biosynthesis methyltransferase [Deltaproteobacteria bacterium]|nr:ubiquinone/menaquinone biosynthesis methyltransferase [Deltaproteobacteria bacterium]